METDVCFFGKSQPTSQSYKDRKCRFLVVSESKITQTLMDMETFRDIHFSYFPEPTPQRSITIKSYAGT